MNRLRHILQVLSAIAIAVVPTWADSQVSLVGKITSSIATALALGIEPKLQVEVKNLVLGACAVTILVLTIVLGKVPAGTSWTMVIGTAVAVASNLRTALGMRPATPPTPPGAD